MRMFSNLDFCYTDVNMHSTIDFHLQSFQLGYTLVHLDTMSRTLILDHIFPMSGWIKRLLKLNTNWASFQSWCVKLRLRRLSPLLKFASRYCGGAVRCPDDAKLKVRTERNVGYDFYGPRRAAIRNASKITCQSWLEIWLLYLFNVSKMTKS